MTIEFGKDGSFELTIGSDQLTKGLRPSSRMPRNSGYLTTCDGAVGRDGVLQALDNLSRIVTDTISDGFPYPQIFVFTDMIIVCGQTTIYEWVSSALVEKLIVTTGEPWSALESHEYVYMSNKVVAVVRDPFTRVYTTTTDMPIANGVCNFNGQIIVGGVV